MINNNAAFYSQLNLLEERYPEQYAMSGFCRIVISDQGSNKEYTFLPPKLDLISEGKNDGGNANTRGRFIETRLKEQVEPVLKTENFRILYLDLAEKFGTDFADSFLYRNVTGAIYTHNGTNVVTKPYCFAYDFDDLVTKGAFFTDIADRPAQHLDSFIQHVIEFVAVTCRETTGAVGLPALFPYLWYFWDKDRRAGYTTDNERYLEQQIQMLVYKLNGSEMRSSESAFTNVSVMDRPYLEHFFGDRTFPNGERVSDHIDEIIDLECVFLDVVNSILSSKLMTFPVITDCLLFDREKGAFVDEETARRFSDLNVKWGNANIYCGTDISALSSCCRVLNDTEALKDKLAGHSNFIGGSDLDIGSVAVVSINLPSVAMVSESIEEFTINLQLMVEDVCYYLETIRYAIARLAESGTLKLYELGMIELERQFNTVGFIGLYDAGNILGFEVDPDEVYDEMLGFQARTLSAINDVTEKFSASREYAINIEQIPGESAAVKLQKLDQLNSGIVDPTPGWYSNQWIPLDETVSIKKRVGYASVLDGLCGGGSILHLNIDAPFANQEQAWTLLGQIANEGVIYFAFNTRISVDELGHGFYGDVCWCGLPKSGEATRPVGFITIVEDWIPTRQLEYRRRTWTTKRLLTE